MPRRICSTERTTNSRSGTATRGLAIVARAACASLPTSENTSPTAKKVSGTSASEVSRTVQKCVVPSLAEPSPRTLRSGVRMSLMSASEPDQEYGPGHGREQQRAGQCQPGEQRRGGLLHADAGIPQEVAQPAQQVVPGRPTEADQHEDAEPRADRPSGGVEPGGRTGRCDQPPGDQQGSGVKCDPG